MTIKPTRKQLNVLNAIKVILARGATPTLRNISTETGCWPASTYQAILSLEKKGLVSHTPRKHGTLRVIAQGTDFSSEDPSPDQK